MVNQPRTDGNQERRTDLELRQLFADAFEVVAPLLDGQGQWLHFSAEASAIERLEHRFPALTADRSSAMLTIIASTRASGRQPQR